MVLDGALVATRDEDQGVNPRGDGLLDGVLDDRLVDHRQQLLWHGDGGWEEARAEAGDRKDGLAKSTHAITRQGRFSGGGAAQILARRCTREFLTCNPI